MGRISDRFRRLRESDRKGLVAFITAGDPDAADTPALMHALVRGGADVIELGVPFSDPMADGPVIQRASERALHAGMTLEAVLGCVRTFRERDADTPVVLMGYLNPFEQMGAAEFAQRGVEAGVDGVLVVDLPPDEAGAFHGEVRAAGLDQIFLVAPTSGAERVSRVCELASGFVYFVSMKGVTGGGGVDFGALAERIDATAAASSLPVGVGFGIRTPQAAADAARVADAVIVGTALVEIIEQHGADAARLEAFAASLRRAIDATADAA